MEVAESNFAKVLESAMESLRSQMELKAAQMLDSRLEEQAATLRELSAEDKMVTLQETELKHKEDIAKLRKANDMGMVKQDMGAARIAMLQKELRGTIKQLGDEKVLMDKQGLILAGADRALREMLSIFRDDPIEGPLQEASMGVWTKILQEES